MYKEMDPLKVFNAITGAAMPGGGATAGMPDPEREKLRQMNQSVLDAVKENATRTRALLGKTDQARMDQFLASVRDVETAATAVSTGMAAAGTSCNTVAAPTLKAGYGMANAAGGYNKGTHMDVMNDLIVMALTCDATRIISYMLEDERSEFVYDHVAAARLLGHRLDPERRRQLRQLSRRAARRRRQQRLCDDQLVAKQQSCRPLQQNERRHRGRRHAARPLARALCQLHARRQSCCQ